ncbi:MAG: flagella basal body P-ring formation protein FlgA [Armatimonadota bacterium]
MAVILTTIALAVPCVAEQAILDLRESVGIESDAITLAQLAEITPAAGSEVLGAVEVGPAPLPGSSRRLTRGYLKMRLRRGGVACGEIVFTGAESVEVRRALQPAATRRETQGTIEAADAPGTRPSADRPPTVDRGTRVRLTVVCGAISIDAEATLLESATVGGRAKMRVEQTREIVVAQIVQPSEAIIRRE